MAVFKKYSCACLILFAVIIITTLLGVQFSLTRQTKKIEAMFTDGVYIEKDRYTQPSISSHLDARAKAALGFAGTASKYPAAAAEEEALREARRALVDADSISGKYAANEALEKAWPVLFELLSSLDPDETDQAAMEAYADDLSGAQKAIQNSAYNQKVSEYRRTVLGTFPISVLRLAVPADEPEYFAVEG